MVYLVFRKALRGHRVALALGALLLLGFNLLIPTTYEGLGHGSLNSLLQNPPKGIEALLKAQGGLLIVAGPNGYAAAGYRHPIFLIIPIGFVVAIASGAVAREVERKSILMLMARPVRRSTLLLGRWGELVAVLAALLALAYAGTLLGEVVGGLRGALDATRFGMVTLNAFLLFLALSSCALFISAAASDGGRATALSVALAVGMFLVDFLAEIWSPFEAVAPLSLFHYYNPVSTAALGGVPFRDMGVLALVAGVALAAAFGAFQRRDLR